MRREILQLRSRELPPRSYTRSQTPPRYSGALGELRFAAGQRWADGVCGFHGSLFPYRLFELPFTTLGLGIPSHVGAQSTFPESRHIFSLHREP
jgi:hypothetical protein